MIAYGLDYFLKVIFIVNRIRRCSFVCCSLKYSISLWGVHLLITHYKILGFPRFNVSSYDIGQLGCWYLGTRDIDTDMKLMPLIWESHASSTIHSG
jgi:hypothetical protein